MQDVVNQLLARRYLLAVLLILLTVATVWGIRYISVDNTFNAILAESDPYRDEVDQVRKDFPPSTAVLFAFMNKDGHLFNMEAIRAMNELTNRYVEVDSAVSVASLSNRRLNAVDANLYDRDYLIPELSTLTDEDLEEIRQIAMADEDLTKSLLSPEGDLALALVKYRAGNDDKNIRLDIAESVIDLRDSLRENYPEVQIYVIGNVLFELDSYKAQIKDSRYLAPLVVTISIGLLWFCLRSLSYAFTILAVSFISIGLTVGTAGWLNMPFNQISTMGRWWY